MKVHNLSFIQYAVNFSFYSSLGIRRLFLSLLSKGRYFRRGEGVCRRLKRVSSIRSQLTKSQLITCQGFLFDVNTRVFRVERILF